MRSSYTILSLLASVALLSNCVREADLTMNEEALPVVGEKGSDAVSGRLVVKFDERMTSKIEAAEDPENGINPLEVKSISESVSSINVRSMRRLFPHAGEFEERTRAKGLHQWYVVEYDEAVSTRSAMESFRLPGVIEVEIQHRTAPVGNPKVLSYVTSEAASSEGVFNDPLLPKQWHYYNDGSTHSSVSGCDINVVPVWQRYTTGNPDVIVAVVDGGIDFKHEDLAANMWVNPKESGDRKYGYNFVTGGPRVTAEDHGTHVAGTIAAVNNNGTGVCGVAGGDAAAGQPGVKLMSCQIFQGEKDGDGAEAIKWSADHGAVISQNSWGYVKSESTPKYLKEAVDYFIEYAGTDKNGNQTGPMKGGIVIFAAGNENSPYGYPAEYEPIVAVSSVGADYRRAYYSNYGDWTDIAAPGGDVKKGNQVLSTLPGNQYGNMQGTSMACPHVSGIAALLVSRFGGPGFTPEALKERLLNYVTDISGFNKSHHLGSGLANCYMAIAGGGGKAPENPSGLTVSAQSNNVTVSVTVPADEDDGTPYSIIIYYGDKENAEENEMFAILYVGDAEAGERISGTIGGLEFEKQYHFAAVASDLASNKSGYTDVVSLTTGPNTVPTIRNLNETSVQLKPHEIFEFKYEVNDPDGHFLNFELESLTEAAVLDTLDKAAPKIRITAAAVPTGTYTARLKVSDIYGAEAVSEATYTVLENHKPYVRKEMEDMVFTSRSGETISYDVKDFFGDDDGEDLKYEIIISNTSVLNMTYAKGQFHLTTMNYGSSEVTIKGTDIRGETAQISFNVLVRNGSKEIEIFPNPVVDYLNIRTGDVMETHVKITSSTGKTVYESTSMIGAMQPARIDMTAFPPGMYAVEVAFAGKTYKEYVTHL